MRHISAPACSLACRVAAGLLATALLWPIAFVTAQPSGQDSVQASADYDQLMQRARAGDTGAALAYLRQLGTNANRMQRFDHIVIASWAGQPEEVLAVYQSLPKLSEPPPARVLQAVARALRDVRLWNEALAHWRAGLAWYPDAQTLFAAGLTMTLADAGQREEALRTGQNWVARWPNDADLRLALAYVYSVQEQPFDALHHTDRALQLAGATPWVQREYMHALRRAGLVRQALQWAEQQPDLYTPAQLRALQADVVALQTRLAAMPSRNEAERFVLVDRALARYDTLMADWQALGAEAAADLTRIRTDRLQALHTRVRMDEVAREYEALRDEGVALPDWAQTDVASAYLYLRQPERARDVYQATVARLEAMAGSDDQPAVSEDAPELLENRIGLLHALTEAEQFDEVPALVARIEHSQPPVITLPGQPEPVPNALYLDAQLAVVTAQMAMDDTPAAQEKMADLVAQAPNNANLRAELAGIHRARGEPRRAEIQLKLAETLAPRDLPVEIGQGLVALDLHEWRQAEALSADTLRRFPESQSAQRLARLWAVHNKRELHVSLQKGLASDSPVSGRGELGIDTTLYSAPIDYNWRGFAGLGYAAGKYAEGSGHHTWQRGGVQWTGRDRWVEAEVATHQYGHGNRLGARLAAALDLDDHWQIGGSAERLARDTPLRALRSRISSDVWQAYLRWRGNERREWRMDVAASRFSDGNQRQAFSVSGSERLVTRPHVKLDLLVDASAQHNNQDAARPYFNPARDLMLLPGLRATHILHRRYETVWEQFVTASVGSYRQQGFGSGSVLGLSYGQRLRYDDVLELMASVNAISRPYDGRRERELQLLLELILRF